MKKHHNRRYREPVNIKLCQREENEAKIAFDAYKALITTCLFHCQIVHYKTLQRIKAKDYTPLTDMIFEREKSYVKYEDTVEKRVYLAAYHKCKTLKDGYIYVEAFSVTLIYTKKKGKNGMPVDGFNPYILTEIEYQGE